MIPEKKRGVPYYNARLNWSVSNKCNLSCVYCINTYPDKKNAELSSIDIPALLGFLERSQKTFRINFGGGEPFLVPNLIEACLKITEKHYVSFDSNLTSSRVKNFADKINPERVVGISATAHIKELEKRHLLNAYIDHVLALWEKGFNVKIKVVAYPDLVTEVNKYKQLFKTKGMRLEFKPFIGRYKNKLYPLSYTDQELEIFELADRMKLKHFFYQRKRVCNSGYNVAIVDTRGDIYICDRLKMKIGNIYDEIIFRKELVICPFQFCACPFVEMDPYLFQKARSECEDTRKIVPIYLPSFREAVDRGIGRVGLFLRHRYPGIYFAYKKINGK